MKLIFKCVAPKPTLISLSGPLALLCSTSSDIHFISSINHLQAKLNLKQIIMPAPLLNQPPLHFNHIVNHSPIVHCWVVVVTTLPNLEVVPPHQDHAHTLFPFPPVLLLRTFCYNLNWILILPEPNASSGPLNLNPGNKIWICGHSFHQNQLGLLVAVSTILWKCCHILIKSNQVTTIIFESPNQSPIFA
jgi:hypothetical protein